LYEKPNSKKNHNCSLFTIDLISWAFKWLIEEPDKYQFLDFSTCVIHN